MARQRSPDRNKAFEIWRDSGGTTKLKHIAAQLHVMDSQIRKWKNQDKWDEKLKGTLPKTKSNVTKKSGAPIGNKNAVGHGAPADNSNAEKHGLFAKYLPPETLELVEHFQKEDQIAKLKRNIAIQEAAIVRAQKIMNVENKEELIKHLKKVQSSEKGDMKEWEFQYAWDRQGNFLSSLARAMTSLTGMYKLLADLDPEDPSDTPKQQIGFYVDALTGTAEEVWDDEEETEE